MLIKSANQGGVGLVRVVYSPATNTGSTRLRGEETNVISGPEFAQGKEDTVDDGKGSNLGLELGVLAGHNVTNKTLQGDS